MAFEPTAVFAIECRKKVAPTLLLNRAESPTATRFERSEFSVKAPAPIATFDVPVELDNNAFDPTAVFDEPVELAYKAPDPKAAL
jgi:hypothetical protein